MKKVILSWLLITIISSLTVIPAPASAEELPDKCTGVYVGKEVSAEGTMLIARSEDQVRGVYSKMFLVQPASDASGGIITDTGEGQNGFSVQIPETTLKFTTLLDAKDLGDGPYYASCMNERGLAVVGTVTTSAGEEYSRIDPLKPYGEGIRESILVGVIACQAVSAEDAVNVLASYIDRYGAAECCTVLFSDPDEAWIFEIYGGSSYAAMRLPDDQMAVFGNEVMLGWADLDAEDGWLFSPNLRDCLEQLEHPVKDKKGRFYLAQCVDPGPRSYLSNMRVWRGQQLFAPSSAEAYDEDEYYPLLFTPDEKVSVLDIMQLYGDRYEGTDYDMELPGNEYMRPIGVTRQSDVHIIQTFPELPAGTCQLQWLAMGNAEHAVFVPAFSGITDTYEKYQIDNTESGVVNDSYYYVCKSICSIAETDRPFLSQGVKDYNLEQEQQMLDKILESIPDIKEAYAVSEENGAQFVTDLAMRMAEEQYQNAQDLYRHLFYTQMDNLNDRPDNLGKTVFSMP